MTKRLKINLSIVIGLCLVLLIACKKKTEPVPVENPTPKSGYVGFLNATKFETLQGVAPTPAGGSTQAYFSSEFIGSNVNPGTYVDAGNNTFNGIQLKKITSSNSIIYIDTSYATPTWPETWIVQGSSSIPSFTLSYNIYSSYVPLYNGYPSLPDTIFLNKNNVIHIWGTNCNYLELLFNSGSNSVTKILNPSLPIFTITPTDISNLTPNNGGTLSVRLTSSTEMDISSGKWVGLNSIYCLTKKNIVFQ